MDMSDTIISCPSRHWRRLRLVDNFRRPAMLPAVAASSSNSVVTNPDRKRYCYPICPFACQIAAVDQVPVDIFGRAIT